MTFNKNNLSNNKKPLSSRPTKKKFVKEGSSFSKTRSKPKKSNLSAILILLIVLGAGGFFAMKMLKPVEVVDTTAVTVNEVDEGPEIITANKIIINSASWGVNCDNKILRNSYEMRDSRRRTYTVKKDNVLQQITKKCGGQKICGFKANKQTLGDPAPNCIKLFEVVFRCFSYDIQRRIEKYQGNKVIINCKDMQL